MTSYIHVTIPYVAFSLPSVAILIVASMVQLLYVRLIEELLVIFVLVYYRNCHNFFGQTACHKILPPPSSVPTTSPNATTSHRRRLLLLRRRRMRCRRQMRCRSALPSSIAARHMLLWGRGRCLDDVCGGWAWLS